MRHFLFLVLSNFLVFLAAAQENSSGLLDQKEEAVIVVDSLDKTPYVDTVGVGFWRKLMAPVYPNPERAAALSFVLPGAGQVYNKKFWYIKVPVIYGGYAFLIQRGESSRKLRNRYQTAYINRINNEPHEFSGFPQDSENALRIIRDQADKDFQLSYIGVVLLHFVQTLEAYTTSHLLKFDMDESLTIAPTLLPSDPMGFSGMKPGVTVGIQLGR